MLLILAILAVVFFIENRLAHGKQIHIHYLCIALFSFFSVEFCNTLLCVALSYWIIRSVITTGTLSIKPYIVPLIITSFILLATGIFSLLVLDEKSMSIMGVIVRNFIVMTFWPVMIAYTTQDILQLRKIVYFYAVTRIIEVAVTGMIIYFFFYEKFYLFSALSEWDISIPEPVNPRLFSIGAPNPNDAAFALLGAFGLIVYRLFNRFRFSDFLLGIVALAGILFTWTRSVWLFIFFYFILFIGLKKKVNKFALLITGVGLLVLSLIAVRSFEERKSSDERLQSVDNASLRTQQLTEYISAIPKIPFFWGLYDDPQDIADKLHTTEEISSENYTLEIFTRNGILAGCLFIVFFLYVIISSLLTTKAYIKTNNNEKDNVVFVIAVFATFISLFLMAQTSLFRNNLILWVMIGFMSVISRQTYFEKNEK